jgi:hypothetical protein
MNTQQGHSTEDQNQSPSAPQAAEWKRAVGKNYPGARMRGRRDVAVALAKVLGDRSEAVASVAQIRAQMPRAVRLCDRQVRAHLEALERDGFLEVVERWRDDLRGGRIRQASQYRPRLREVSTVRRSVPNGERSDRPAVNVDVERSDRSAVTAGIDAVTSLALEARETNYLPKGSESGGEQNPPRASVETSAREDLHLDASDAGEDLGDARAGGAAPHSHQTSPSKSRTPSTPKKVEDGGAPRAALEIEDAASEPPALEPVPADLDPSSAIPRRVIASAPHFASFEIAGIGTVAAPADADPVGVWAKASIDIGLTSKIRLYAEHFQARRMREGTAAA